MIKLIAAVGPNNLIGIGNKMAWRIPKEFKFFKETTIGHTLLFGRTTFLGLPGKLPGRKCIVLGTTGTEEADISITSEEEVRELFEKYKHSEDILFIAGGKSIYEQFYLFADEIFISEVQTSVLGDVFLDIDLSSYKKTMHKAFDEFTVYKYVR